ncbi:hypothetical protein, partial [Clostridium sp. HCS.1]|uniref:hypothetical protein n=1 Tax=Clostridium sp. HCS.1 TaxID=3238594 RepID=UPI003A0FF382
MYHSRVVPRDKDHVIKMVTREYMMEHLKKEDSYSFHFTIIDEQGEVLTKNLTVSAIDLRVGRVCLSRTDIT